VAGCRKAIILTEKEKVKGRREEQGMKYNEMKRQKAE
jgi:hypothetical protein